MERTLEYVAALIRVILNSILLVIVGFSMIIFFVTDVSFGFLDRFLSSCLGIHGIIFTLVIGVSIFSSIIICKHHDFNVKMWIITWIMLNCLPITTIYRILDLMKKSIVTTSIGTVILKKEQYC